MRYCKRRRVDNRRPRPRPRPREQQQQKSPESSSSAIPIHSNHICESHSHRLCTTALNHHHHYKDATANKSAFPSPRLIPICCCCIQSNRGRVNENFVGEKKWLHRSSRLLVDTRFELTPFCSFIACSGWRIIIIIVVPPIPTLIHGTDSEPESASNNKWKCPSSTHHIPAKDETEQGDPYETRHGTTHSPKCGKGERRLKKGKEGIMFLIRVVVVVSLARRRRDGLLWWVFAGGLSLTPSTTPVHSSSVSVYLSVG